MQHDSLKALKSTDREFIVDSGCGQNLCPDEVINNCLQNALPVENEQILTADASDNSALDVLMKGSLPGKLRVEHGHYKDVELPWRTVARLRKFLFSVPWCIRQGYVVHFEADNGNGGDTRYSGEWRQ